MELLTNYNEKQIAELKIILLMSAKNHLGIANLPNENDLKQIVNFLKEKFFEFNLIEIEKAFQMYASGEIVTESKPYGVLSTAFISEVLQEYRQFRKMWKDIAERKQQKLLPEPVVDQEKVGKELFEFLLNYYLKNNQLPIAYDWESVYFHMEKEKEINLTAEEKMDYYNVMKDDLIQKINYYRNSKSKEKEVKNWLELLNDKKRLAKQCREQLVKLYFINQLKTKRNGNNTNTSTNE